MNTILYVQNNTLCCHSVGLLGCIKIEEKEISNNAYEYKAIYDNNTEIYIENVIVATDVKLT